MVDINQKDRVIRIKIVYYGPALGGKTSNLKVLHEQALAARRGQFVSVNSMQDRTILCDLLPLRSGGFRGYDLRLQLLAVPGQAMYGVTRRVILKGADGIVFVANSASDRQSENIQSQKEMNANLVAHDLDPNMIPLVIQYNKRDLPQVALREVLEHELNLKQVPSFPAVAPQGKGVLETFAAIVSLTVQDLCRRYRTMQLPPGQSVEAWAKEAVKGMFGRERLDLPKAEEPDEPPVEIELPDGSLLPIAPSGPLRVRVPVPEEVPRAAGAPVPEAHSPETLAASYAAASTELGLAVHDMREERDALRSRLEEIRRTLELATEPPGVAGVEARVHRVLQVLARAAGASCATLRLVTMGAPQIVALPPLVSDPLSRTTWGRDHLDRLGGLPEPLVEEATDSGNLTDALRAAEPSFEAVAIVPLRSAERLLGLALLYYELHDVLPSHDTLVHLGLLARALAGPLEAEAAREAASAADHLRVLSRASAAAVASLLVRLPPEVMRHQRLDLAEVLSPLRVPGVSVEMPATSVAVVGDAPLLRFALAALVHLCEADAIEHGQLPEVAVRTTLADGGVRVTLTVSGRGSALSAAGSDSEAWDAELSVVQTVVDLHGGVLVQGRAADQRPQFTVQLGAA